MPMTAYMKLTGANQGAIDGDCQQKGREKTILIYALDHSVETPVDSHTGQATGKRMHKPLIITKHIDTATPKLQQACSTSETMTDVEIDFYQINQKGQEEHYFTIKLTNAVIVKTRLYKPMTFVPDNKPFHDMEEVHFNYQKIIWTYNDGGIEAEDDWDTPASA